MIKDLKELQTFLKICRKQRVGEIRFSGIHVVFDEPPKKEAEQASDEGDVPDEPLGEEPSVEQLMYFSVGAPNENQEN